MSEAEQLNPRLTILDAASLLLLRRMANYIREYEEEHGEISDEEIARTRTEVEQRSRPWRGG